MSAAELWAFPFEACRQDGAPVFANDTRNLIITRRIRHGFAGRRQPWPIVPRVLYVHAPQAEDLSQELIDEHRHALASAMAPWSKKGDAIKEKLLVVCEAWSPTNIKNAIESDGTNPFTHVHILAHGGEIQDPIEETVRWGLRLGTTGKNPTDPEDLAKVIQPSARGLPVVVTIRACDSANQASSAIPEKSFAQELHVLGIPIVIASQLPLTKNGSTILTKVFYENVLVGVDVRWALHKARLALKDSSDSAHDWLSVVGYVQLPEGYDDHLLEVGLKRDMARLRILRQRRDEALDQDDPAQQLSAIEGQLNERLEAIRGRLAAIPASDIALRTEGQGMLASTDKRYAELLFRKATPMLFASYPGFAPR